MSDFLRRLFGTWAAHRRPAARLRVEPLDGRDCPSVTVIPAPGGVVTVTGDAAPDTVVIVQNDAANQLTVQYNSAAGPAVAVFPSLTTSRVITDLRGGDDRLEYHLASDLWAPKTLANYLGAGNDWAAFDLGAQTPRLIRASLGVVVYGESGHDTVQADFGVVSAVPVQFVGLMGSENDYCSATLRGMVGGARCRFDLRGEAGDDTLKFANVNNVSGPTSSLDVQMQGGDGNDTLVLYVDAIMGGAYRLHLDGGAGKDYVEAEVTARPNSTGSLDLSVWGGDDDDQMGTRFINQAPGQLTVLQAVMDGGAGIDTVQPWTTPNVMLVNFP